MHGPLQPLHVLGAGWARRSPRPSPSPRREPLTREPSRRWVGGDVAPPCETVEPSRCTSPLSQARFLQHPEYTGGDHSTERDVDDGEEGNDGDDVLPRGAPEPLSRRERAPSMPCIRDGYEDDMYAHMATVAESIAESPPLPAALLRSSSMPHAVPKPSPGGGEKEKPGPSEAASLAVKKLVSMMTHPLG